jgi:serine phosphatase RsbU (regulator of sigma subunit)
MPGYEFAATCIPARDVGGDFFDWGGTADSVRITLGDVSGKGMPAALLMATARAALRAATRLPVGEAVNAVNQALLEDLEQFDAFVTMFHAELSANGALTYVDAGHGLALIIRADGTMTMPPTGQVPIGILPDVVFVPRHDHLAPGDTLVMYSDGLADARPDLVLENPANFTSLCHQGSNALQTLERTVDAVDVHRALPDDLTIVMVHRQASLP